MTSTFFMEGLRRRATRSASRPLMEKEKAGTVANLGNLPIENRWRRWNAPYRTARAGESPSFNRPSC